MKHQKFLKYNQTDYLQDIVCLFMLLLTANFVKNSHIYAKLFYISLKTVLNQS